MVYFMEHPSITFMKNPWKIPTKNGWLGGSPLRKALFHGRQAGSRWPRSRIPGPFTMPTWPASARKRIRPRPCTWNCHRGKNLPEPAHAWIKWTIRPAKIVKVWMFCCGKHSELFYGYLEARYTKYTVPQMEHMGMFNYVEGGQNESNHLLKKTTLTMLENERLKADAFPGFYGWIAKLLWLTEQSDWVQIGANSCSMFTIQTPGFLQLFAKLIPHISCQNISTIWGFEWINGGTLTMDG